jgi:hypothetical protein
MRAGGLVDHPVGSLDGVIGEAFVVAAEQGDIDRRGCAVRPSRVHHEEQQLIEPSRSARSAGSRPHQRLVPERSQTFQ